MIALAKKTYLSEQIYLMGLTTSDLFTQEEWDCYQRICSLKNTIDHEDEELAKNSLHDPSIRESNIAAKKEEQETLAKLIASHKNVPRQVRLNGILDTRKLPKDEDGNTIWPEGITWNTLKPSKKIAEFSSEMSRAMGLSDKEVTFNKIIMKWKSEDILEQIVENGFDVPVLDKNSLIVKHFVFITSSAGQLRTDKIACMEIGTWTAIQPRMMCGLTFDKINELGGINVNKLLAYIALTSSATLPWLDFDIDRSIVVPDFEAPVTCESDYINDQYVIDRGIHTTMINHVDGAGMMLPCVSRKNFMFRAPWVKGLLCSFDFIRFCKVNNCEAKLTDIYGQEHDLIAENIQIIFTKSQFKLYKYYESWDAYKQAYKENKCQACYTNFEEDYFPDKTMCYQFLQTLTDFTDEEIEQFTKKTHDRIEGIASSQTAMLECLKADPESESPYKKALAIYPELLREAYTRETLKNIKKKWMLDAKSGKIKIANKRLFAIPDWYAACEHWFLGVEEPNGLLANGEVACRIYRSRDIVDCLRSPHLNFEHCIRKVVKDQDIYNWFYTDGIYTSVKDPITKVLAFDVDGDQINVVGDDEVCTIAQRNIEKYDIVPLFFDLGKAGAHQLSRQEFYHGLKRAHEYSGIGQVSNSLTKLWNKDNPDRYAAEALTFYNNLCIDAAKTGFVNAYEDYPDIKKRINKAIGGKHGRMPFFFQFSKNGRRFLPGNSTGKEPKEYAKPNKSTMNRICAAFDDIGRIKMNYANIPPFNWQMLLVNNDEPYNITAVEIFVRLDNEGKTNLNVTASTETDSIEQKVATIMDFVCQDIINELTEKCGSLEKCYSSIVRYLFAGANLNKAAHKQTFWKVFGDIACRCIEENLQTYTVCDKCGMKIPAWADTHACPKDTVGFFECCDCGTWCQRTNSREIRCKECQAENRMLQKRINRRKHYIPKKKVA